MATNKRNRFSKEIEDFTTELMNYIWGNLQFVYPLLEEEFREKLSLIFKKPRKKSNFEDYIGNAVICSQYLLREYCNYMLKSYGTSLIEFDILFYLGVLQVISFWTIFRENVFLKMIDTAAISVEAVLFCAAEFKVRVDSDRASYMFKYFYTQFLQTEFRARGGWSALKAKILKDYHTLHLDLQPFIRCKKDPYEKLDHSCHLIKQLRMSPVRFPIPESMFCTSCREPSENIRVVCDNKGKLFYEIFKNVFIRIYVLRDEKSSQNIDELKNCLVATFASEFVRPDLKTVFKVLENNEAFLTILLGKEEEQEKKGGRKETKSRKRTRRWKKARSMRRRQ